jgi:hypothetical protein
VHLFVHLVAYELEGDEVDCTKNLQIESWSNLETSLQELF